MIWTIKFQPSKNRLWISNWRADDRTEENGVSYTENKGDKWFPILKGYKIRDFAFRDSISYFASEDGLIRTDDNYKTFSLYNNIYDPVTKYRITLKDITALEFKNDTLWIGTNDGLVYTIDNSLVKPGSFWKIFRTYKKSEENQTYAYPNPFSPDDEIIRIHYKIKSPGSFVTIEIFDFAMNLVRRLISNVQRNNNFEQEEIWDGKSQNGKRIPNGTYFYRIIVNDEIYWNKIVVLQ